ncbi:regulating synaptic membrane exocytosis protein 2-like isoform X3 [Acanthaster planci]|uniref:Regulating synaptic membrane exocytosis protein 2-like isoform X3 n=1 Tax=Acanthaster planci TaxID=133434 RepID=A0A8B7YFM0_ACAPL|nr:regulating synaptic membrane exocytosis protein 2-like isoform X3 [Acanthaster planci]
MMATPQSKAPATKTVQPLATKPGAAAPAPPGPAAQPPAGPVVPELDLSHLSEEERRQIQAVLERQKQEEEKEAKLIRALKEDLDRVQQTTQAVASESKAKGSLPQNGAVCQICHKTKFADGVGHSCSYCNLKSCARCGGRVTLRSNKPPEKAPSSVRPKVLWVCKLCRKKQEFLTKTGQWYHGRQGKPQSLDLSAVKAIDGGSKPQTPQPAKDGPQQQQQQIIKPQMEQILHSAKPSNNNNKENLGAGQPPSRPRSTTPHSQLTRQLSKNEDETSSPLPQTNSKPVHRTHSRELAGKRPGAHDERTHNARADPSYDPSSDVHYQDRRRESRYSMRDRTPDRDRSTSSERTTMTERHGRDPAKYSGREREHFMEQDPRRFKNQDHIRDHGRYPDHERERDRERFNHGYESPDRHGYPEERYYAGDHDRGRHYTKEPLVRQVSGRTLDRQRRMYADDPPSPHYPHDRYPEHTSSDRERRDMDQREIDRRETEHRELSDRREMDRRDMPERREGVGAQMDMREFERHPSERRTRARRERDRSPGESKRSSPRKDEERFGEEYRRGAGPPYPQEGVSQKRPNSSPRHSITVEDVDAQRERLLLAESYGAPGRAPELGPKQHLDPSSAATKTSKQESLSRNSKAADSMIRADSLSSDQSECVRPPPPKPHKTKGSRKRRQFSLSSSEEEIRSTPEYTSCEEGEIESESVSERGSGELEIGTGGGNNNSSSKDKGMHGGRGEPVAADDHHHSESELALSAAKKKIVRFGQGEGRSMEEDPEWSEPQIKDSGVDTGSSTTLNEEHSLASKQPVTWTPDLDNNRLIGHMILKKSQGDSSTPQDSSAILGLKVKGGKVKEAGKLGAFISRVKRGSIADTVGHLRAGDEVLSWNGHNLQGKDVNEVYTVIFESKSEPQVELKVARPMGSEMDQTTREKLAQQFRSQRPDSITKRSSQSSSGYESTTKHKEEEEIPPQVRHKRPSVTITSPGSPGMTRRNGSPLVQGDLQMKLWYDNTNYQIGVTILSVKGLPPREKTGDLRNPYVKMYLLPERSDESKRRTKTLHKTLNPKWNQTFLYGPLKRSEFKGNTLEVTVWDFEHYGANEFLGEVMLNLEAVPLDDEPHLYPLRSHNKQVPLPLVSPVPARHQMKHHSHRNSDTGSREQLSSPASGGRITDSEFSDWDDGIGVVTGASVVGVGDGASSLGERRATPPMNEGSSVVGIGDGASVSSLGSSCSPPPASEDDRPPNEQEYPRSPTAQRRSGIVIPPQQDELSSHTRERRGSASTLAVPERAPRSRPRSPSPTRRERMSTEPVDVYRKHQEATSRFAHYQDDTDGQSRQSPTAMRSQRERDRGGWEYERSRDLRDRDLRDQDLREHELRELDLRERDLRSRESRERELRDLPPHELDLPSRGLSPREPHDQELLDREGRDPRDHRTHRALSPPTRYDYERMSGRRSRSPSRRADLQHGDPHRRTQSENRGEMDYERQYRSHARTITSNIDASSLPNSPVHGGRGSPVSTPSTPRKHRQLPQVPAHLKSDKGTAEIEERARQMKLKMKINQYKQAAATANTLSPHGAVASTSAGGTPILDAPPHPRRKQSPDNISIKSSDSNVSSTSDVSAITQASTASAFSTQSERRPTRKLSAFTAKMQESAPVKKPLNRSNSSADMYTYDRNEGSISDSAADTNIQEGKKRRASIGYKMASLVGLSKKSNSTSNLAGKKPRSSIVRSEEVGLAAEMRNRLQKQASRESTDGSVCSFSSDSSSQLWLPGNFRLGPEGQFDGFLEGLGPAQLVGRQVLGSPCLGDIQVGLEDKRGKLEVEIIRARGLISKSVSKVPPAPYVKVYLMDGKRCVGKKKTKIARKTLNPLYQQVLLFEEDYRNKILQITVWADYGRMERKVFMGVAQIMLDDLDLSHPIIGYYKLFNTSSISELHGHRASISSLEGSMTSLASAK